MRRRLILLGLVILGVSAPALAQVSVPDCVTVGHQARWAAASYNHWVWVNNACDGPVQCTVATDVNPEEIALTVPRGERREVLTFRGSPASVFTPRVRCTESD